METADGKAIMIVDDEMSFTDLLGRLLGDHFRCPILTFSNPLTAMEAMPRLDIGVVVTDYYMPHVNGIDLIRKVAELITPDPPACILITGHSFEHDDESERLPQFKAVLPKPFRWQQLAVLIEKHWPAGAASPLREGVTSLHR